MNLLWQWLLAYWMTGTMLINSSSLSHHCESCHPVEVAEWRQSRHALAFTNGLFRYEFTERRQAWCASCHAPSAANPATVSDNDPVAMEGIGCVACHINDKGKFISTSKGDSSPHNTIESKSFTSEKLCERCHQFNFPIMGPDGMPTGFLPLPMQDTVVQFRKSRQAAKGMKCRSCHMKTPGKHLFPGSHDPKMLRSALRVQTCLKANAKHIVIRLTNSAAAHSVPTGGVNRHIVLRSWRSSRPELVSEFFLGRRFKIDSITKQKALVEDLSLASGETRSYEVAPTTLGGTRDEAINIELRFIYPLEEFAPLPQGSRQYAIMNRDRVTVSELSRCTTDTTPLAQPSDGTGRKR